MFSMRILVTGILAAALVAALTGCAAPDGRLGNDGGRAAPNPPLARGPGFEIRQDDLLAVLYPERGRTVLDRLILLELVRAHAARRGVPPAAELTNAEMDRVLSDIAGQQPPLRRAELLSYLLASRGLSQAEFNVLIETRALLRSSVSREVSIDNAMLRDEFERQYGRRVQVRRITVSNLRRMDTVLRRLANGETFAALVEEFSEHQASLVNGGLMGPFSRVDDDVPADLRQAAFALSGVGARSDVITHRDGNSRQLWTLLELTWDVPAENVTYDQVADDLVAALRERIINQRMAELAQRLRNEARVEVLDPRLRGPITMQYDFSAAP